MRARVDFFQLRLGMLLPNLGVTSGSFITGTEVLFQKEFFLLGSYKYLCLLL